MGPLSKMHSDAAADASIMGSRKRKREDRHQESGQPTEHTSSGRIACVRSTLVDLRSGRLDEDQTRTHLLSLNNTYFPRQDEWLVGFYLEKLSRLAKALQFDDDADMMYWSPLSDLCQKLPAARLKLLFRRIDLVQLLRCRFDSGRVLSNDLLAEMTRLLHHLTATRTMRTILLTTTENAYATLTAFLRCLSSENPFSILNNTMINFLVDIVILSVTSRSSTKKFQEVVHSAGIDDVAALLERHQSAGLSRLLSSSIFSETSLSNSQSLTSTLESVVDKGGFHNLCSLSFESVNENIKNSAKRLELRNSLLRIWLGILPENRDVVLDRYRRTRSEQDSNISRPLSSDPATISDLEPYIESALTQGQWSLSFIVTVLEVDFDAIVPKHSEAIWKALESSARSVIDLALGWLSVHVEIRDLSGFLERFCQLPNLEDGILSHRFLALLSSAFNKASAQSQEQMLVKVLDTRCRFRTKVLTAMVHGRQQSGLVAKFAERILLYTDADDSGMDDLRRAVLLKLNRHDASKIGRILLSAIQNTSHSKRISFQATEAWLRLRELNLPGLDELQSGAKTWIDALLVLCSVPSDHKILVLRTILERWLPVLCSVMDQSQKNALAASVCSSMDTVDVKSISLLTDPRILENDDLHDSLQLYLSDVTKARTQHILALIPISFFHKAVRRKILDALIQLDHKDSITFEVLLKFASTGLIPKFEDAAQYGRLASTMVAREEELRRHGIMEATNDATTIKDVRKIFVKTVSNEICLAILNDSSLPILLRIELYEELQDREVAECSCDSIIDWIVPRLHAHATDTEQCDGMALYSLLRLVKSEVGTQHSGASLSIIQSLLDKASGGTDSLSLLLKDIVDTELGRVSMQKRFNALELLSWTASSASRALPLLQELASPTGSDSTVEISRCMSALARTIEGPELHILVKDYALMSNANRKDLLVVVLQLITEFAKDTRKAHESFDVACLVDNIFWISKTLAEHDLNLTTHQVTDHCIDALQELLNRYPRSVHTGHLDCIYTAVAHIGQTTSSSERVLLASHKLLRTSFEHHAHLLRNRYHITVNMFQILLRTSTTVPLARSLDRLFSTFLTSSRRSSTKPEIFDRAISKHLPWLLIEYLSLITPSTAVTELVLQGQVRTILEEGLVYEIMGLCGTHEREMIGASVDAASRGMFKKIYDEWTRFGKWREI